MEARVIDPLSERPPPPPVPVTPRRRSLAPKEHGAYGQLFFPLVSALVLAHFSPVAVLFAAAAAGLFFAHEPLLVLLGQRGRRALDEVGALARQRLAILGGGSLAAGLVALVLSPPAARVFALVPMALGVVLGYLVLRRLEKSTAGESLAATALSSCSLPVALAGGASVAASVTAFAVWSALFVAATLVVRGLIAHSRGRASVRLLAGSIAFALAATVAGAWLAARGVVGVAVPVSLAPALVVVVALVARRPKAKWLKEIGWAVIAASTITLLALAIGLR